MFSIRMNLNRNASIASFMFCKGVNLTLIKRKNKFQKNTIVIAHIYIYIYIDLYMGFKHQSIC